MRTLSHQQARRVYDRIGARQDSQAFYEDVATGELIRHGEFGSAGAVFEFGCGTGRFARMLLDDHLGPAATYRGTDLSPTMVGLAQGRLAGCRPIELLPFLEAGRWQVRHHLPLAPYGLPSEAVVAERLPESG